MQTWPVRDAQARFGGFLAACITPGPPRVTRRGAEAAVLVPVAERRRLQAVARPSSLKELLLSDAARGEPAAPPRGGARRRKAAGAG